MRYTVTALGSAGGRPVGAVVGTIARYLVAPQPPPETPGAAPPGGGEVDGSVVRYYADRGDSPGRWLGQGASELGLAGKVDFDDFTKVLAGRDPRNGARLITARGSPGRVASLGTGTVAMWGPNGEALYSVRDAARILGWTQADVRAAISDGEQLGASRLLGALAGTAIPAETLTAGTTGNGPSAEPGRDRHASTRTPGPEQRPVGDRDDTGNGPERHPGPSRDTGTGTGNATDRPGRPAAPDGSVGSERLQCHNDFGAEHLLVTPDRGTLTGVIDWADAGRADPAVDLGRLYRDLGPGTVELIPDLLGSDRGTTAVRARFYACCTLLEDLHHGLETGDHRYSNAALQNLARTYDAGAIDEHA